MTNSIPKKTIELTLTIDETNLILEALGALPFARVYSLIGQIQHDAQAQLRDAAPAPSVSNGLASIERPAAVLEERVQ